MLMLCPTLESVIKENLNPMGDMSCMTRYSIEFDILEKPEVGKACVVTKWGTFDPKKEKKNLFRMNLKEVVTNPNMERETPVELCITFHLPMSKSVGKAKKQKMLNNEIKHTLRPDADNLQKFLLDTLKGVGFRDDSQIWRLTIEKRWSENPRTSVKITYH